MIGQLTPLTKKFFHDDAPLVQKEDQEIMCWKTTLTDETGHVRVKVWDKPCYEIFGVTASKLRELWEQGVEQNEDQESILQDLNKNMNKQIECRCEAVIWQRGKTNENMSANVNVYAVDIKD